MMEKEIKLTLPQLLSLYTGGRPVGLRDFNEQHAEFFINYGQLMYINILPLSGHQKKEAEKMNFENMLESINQQYPSLKKSKLFMKVYQEYMEQIPTLYDDDITPNYLNHCEYQILSQRLLKVARLVLGSNKTFILKKPTKSYIR